MRPVSRAWLRNRSALHAVANGSLITARQSIVKRSEVVIRRHATFSDTSDSIFALSTPPGRGAIAIIRISGPACIALYRALCPNKPDPRPRHANVRTLYAPQQPATINNILDANALVLHFPAPNTVTGEDVLELHVHGGPAIVQAVLSSISKSSLPLRYAEPGEFTRRAFGNDKLDLTQVEALGDVLSATTEQQRKLSVRGTSGDLRRRYDEWRSQLLYARGELEALIDFSEDQHFDESTAELMASVAAQVHVLASSLQLHIKNAVRGELLRNGIMISLLGAPNAGKSSLLNRIVGREAAIVSQEAGTTRDVVEVGLDIGGYLCRIGDTAGLRRDRSNAIIGEVEKEGMRRATARAAESDVVILVFDLRKTASGLQLHLDTEVIDTGKRLIREERQVLAIINKTDLAGDDAAAIRNATRQLQEHLPDLHADYIFPLSCRSDQPCNVAAGLVAADRDASGDVTAFLTALISRFHVLTAALSPEDVGDGSRADPGVWEESLGVTTRHKLLLEQCLDCLNGFLSLADQEDDADIVIAAEHLRSAADCLARITGKGEAGDVEEVLGVVFEKFCVGK